MPRSIKIQEKYITKVKHAVQRQGYARQKDLAEELGISLATVSHFLNGKPIDVINFDEICQRLGLDKEEIVDYTHIETNGNNSDLPNHNINTELEEAIDEVVHFPYVERPPVESIFRETITEPGALLRIKGAGLMGKSSLMAKMLPQFKNKGYRIALLNLHYADSSHFSNLDKFLQWFCVSVGRALNLPNRLADYWDEEFSTSKINCTAYFEEYLLGESDNPLILCLDEAQQIFPYTELAQEFLGLLRAWHEQAKTRPVWGKLRLVVAHSTEVYVPLKLNESPFTVGKSIQLPIFTVEQAHDLANHHGLKWELSEIKQLVDVVGGYPYLLGEAFSHLKMHKGLTLGQILQTAATESGIYRHHLRHYWNLIEKNADLAEALKKLVTAQDKVPLEPTQAYKLDSMGLVHLLGNEVEIGCNLYRQYFSYCFGLNH
ncbi:MAG: helix-turn-helix domain-containing protein [Symploca sp. SIO3E6]|nr:helix-turn-helix domain-containing protein [Caldora sp. SIO3E6]